MHSFTFILSMMFSFTAGCIFLEVKAQGQELGADDSASSVETTPSSDKKKSKKKPASEPVETQDDETQSSTVPPKPEETDSDKKTEAPIVRSATSIALDERLSLGTAIGWAYVKPSAGTWSGLGTSTLSGSWRKSPKPDGSLFITGRYTPYSGVWRLNDRDYDTTIHGGFIGASWLLPFAPGKSEIKAGVELGYLMVYAIPQDGAEVDGKAKGGKVAGGFSTEINWTFLSKLKIGPVIRVGAGSFSSVFVGAAANYVF